MPTGSSTPGHLHFLSVKDEIQWLKADAELGHAHVQHRLGRLYLDRDSDTGDLYQAYKWLFISVALGHLAAKDDLIEVNRRLDDPHIDKAYQLAEDWFRNKFNDDIDWENAPWSPELMKWRFAPGFVH